PREACVEVGDERVAAETVQMQPRREPRAQVGHGGLETREHPFPVDAFDAVTAHEEAAEAAVELLRRHVRAGEVVIRLEVGVAARIRTPALLVDECGYRIREMARRCVGRARPPDRDRKSTRLNSSHVKISYAVFCL